MDSKTRNRVTTFIHQTLDPNTIGGEFNKSINVPFIPKTVRVNNILYFSDAADSEDGASILTSDLIDGSTSLDSTLFVFNDTPDSHSPDNTFNLNKAVRGIYTFRYTRPADRAGGLSFSLTFED